MAMGQRRLHDVLVLLLVMLQGSGFAMGLYGPSSDVVQLSPWNFKSRVLKADGIVLVVFFFPWSEPCQALAPAWENSATALKGLVTVAALDADAHYSLAHEYGIMGFPTIKAFGAGQQVGEYQGPRGAKGIVDYALGQVRSLAQQRLGGKSGGGSKKSSGKSYSVELTSNNFNELVLQSTDIWLVEFFAPWCGHCRKLAPEWKTAADNMKGKLKLGQVDCDAENSLKRKYGVKGFPTILLFGADKSNPSPYEGGRVASEIQSFALRQLEDHAAEVVELTGPDVRESQCSSATICFVTFLRDILDSTAERRNQEIALLQLVAEKFKRRSYGYVWAAAGQQAALEKAVDVGGYGYPAMVAVNIKTGLYDPLRSDFELCAVVDFIEEAGLCEKGHIPLKGEASIVQTEPWDGKDGQLIEED